MQGLDWVGDCVWECRGRLGGLGKFEIFVANPLLELGLLSPVAGLPGKCSL